MKNEDLKELIEKKKSGKEVDKTFQVFNIYADNGDAVVDINIPFGKSEYNFAVSENDLTSWKEEAPSTLNDVDWYADIMDIHVQKEERVKLLKNIEKTYDFFLSLEYEMN